MIRLILILLLLPLLASAAGEVLITEVAWMGTEVSANDEWIKLENKTGAPISLEGWNLSAEDGSPDIALSGTIDKEYYLERTDDGSNPDQIADLVYTGALSNSGEHLKLSNSSGDLIDEIDHRGGWVSGDNETKETMKRNADGSFVVSIKKSDENRVLENSQGNTKKVLKLKERSKIPVFLIGFIVAFCSAVVFLIFKKNVKGFWY